MSVASTTNHTGFIQGLFTPLPQENGVHREREKDALDHVAGYIDTSTGSWDLFRVVELVLSYFKAFSSSATAAGTALVDRISGVINTAGIGLSIPSIITDGNTFRRSVVDFFQTQDLPYSDQLRARKISQAAKKSFLDGMTFTNTLSQASLFLDKVDILKFAPQDLKVIDGIYNVTSVITDGAELVEEGFKLKQYETPQAQPRTDLERRQLDEKKQLSWMKIAKDVASVALSAIAIGAVIFGIATEAGVISAVILVLSTGWLTMKITCYFYNKIVVERHG